MTASKDAGEIEDLYHNAPCGFHSLDREGLFLRINDTELSWLGYSREELIGKRKFTDIVAPEDLDEFRAAFEKLAAGKDIENLEINLLKKEGNRLPVLASIDALRSPAGNFLMSRASVVLISRRKNAETALAALLESEGRYRSVISAMAEGIVLLDKNGEITLCNPAAEKILGTPIEVGKKHLCPCFQAIHEDGTPFLEENHPAAITLRSGKPCKGVVMGFQRPEESETTWILFHSEPLFQNGNSLGVMASFTDITHTKRQQEELQQSYSALRELSFKLQHAREEEQARIAREIHDELGSALTAVKFDMSWAVERMKREKCEPDFTEVLQGLDSAIQKIKRICSDLRPSILDDLGLWAAVEWQAEEFRKRTGVACELEMHGKEPRLHPELATGIFRIFQETLTNITRHADATVVRLELYVSKNNIKLIVTDNGKGIDPKRIIGSQSLGILGMSERAQALGGSLGVRPVSPRGTEVALSIPMDRRKKRRSGIARFG